MLDFWFLHNSRKKVKCLNYYYLRNIHALQISFNIVQSWNNKKFSSLM